MKNGRDINVRTHSSARYVFTFSFSLALIQTGSERNKITGIAWQRLQVGERKDEKKYIEKICVHCLGLEMINLIFYTVMKLQIVGLI